jgi:hypothetical protein
VPTFYSDRLPSHVDDVFPGWILGGDVSSLSSVGGGSKGLLVKDIQARISRAWPMPPFTHDDPLADWDNVATAGYVLDCPLEDDPDRTSWHRLNAAGADMTRVAVLEQLALPEDFGKLRSEIDNLGDCRLVVIDPFMSAATTTTAFNQQLRHKLLNPLIHIARETGAGIWLVHHMTKGTSGGRLAANSTKNLTDYVAGSKGFTDTLRMNTIVRDSPLDPKIKEWAPLKANGGGCDPLEYLVVASRPNDPDAHIEWRMPPLNLADPRVFGRIQEKVAAELAAAPFPLTPQALTVQCGVPFALVNRALANLEAAGAVTKRRGAYTVAAAVSPARAAKAIAPPAEPGLVPVGARLAALLESGRVS